MEEEINIGDCYKPKKDNPWYQGLTLKVVNIRFTEKKSSEHRIDTLASNGETDSFWREGFLRDYEKV